MHSEKVAILDAGSQYGKLIDRRIRELNVESHILPLNTTAKQLLQDDYKAIIISGGPANLSSASSMVSSSAPSSAPSPQPASLHHHHHQQQQQPPPPPATQQNSASALIAEAAAAATTTTVKPMEIELDNNSTINQVQNNSNTNCHTGDPGSINVANNNSTATATATASNITSTTTNLVVNNGEYDTQILHCGLPVLGICYGFHLINKEFHGTVQRKDYREDGQFNIQVDINNLLFKGLSIDQLALLTHGDSIHDIAMDFKPIAMSGPIIAGIANEKQRLYGVQFHPEVDLTINGKSMLKNFLYEIAGLKGIFTMQSREPECIENIRQTVGKDKVLVLLSGGVDSTVCAALFRRALGPEQVIAYHIDNGFMRKDESDSVEKSLNQLGLEVKVIKAEHQFLNATTTVQVDPKQPKRKRTTKPLCKVTAPEEKRKIIGDTFIRIANDLIAQLDLDPDHVFLGQGTLRPDLIESASHLASSSADAIKTHHNDTELVRLLRAKGRVIEPLKDFHKDEVRILGRDLGLPEAIVNRHPFPGPGLAIRVICAQEPYMEKDFSETSVLAKVIVSYAASLKRQHPLIGRIQKATSPEEQQFLSRVGEQYKITSTLLPIRSVGVQGDCRTYSYVVALSSDVEPTDWHDMARLAKTIPRICHNVNRVCWVFDSTVQYSVNDITPTTLTPQVLSILREADSRAQTILQESNYHTKVSQMPVILIPIHFDRDVILRQPQPSCQYSIVLRTFVTEDFMTGVPVTINDQVPLTVFRKIVDSILQVPSISRVLYDLTPKPPGTTEWE